MKKRMKFYIAIVGASVCIMFAIYLCPPVLDASPQNIPETQQIPQTKIKILLDAGHGGKYLRQKNKKDLCGRTGLEKYANKPKIRCIHKLNDSVSLAILFDLRIIFPKSGKCTDKLWIMLPQTG